MLSIERAEDVLAGGCDSPVRSAWGVGGPMFVQAAAEGAYAYDEAGRRCIDYIMAYGPLLFGHTHPALTGVRPARISRFRLGLDAFGRGASRAAYSRAPAFDGTDALCHQRNRSDDERGSCRPCLYEAHARAQVCRQLPRTLRSRTGRGGRLGRARQAAEFPTRSGTKPSSRVTTILPTSRNDRAGSSATWPRSWSSRSPGTWD